MCKRADDEESCMQENEHLPLDDFVLRLRKWAQVCS